jgi:hypothetical protein
MTPASSLERLVEVEAALVELRRRQEAQPKDAVARRMRLALLISAFERRRDLTLAKFEEEKVENASDCAGVGASDCGRDAGVSG